MYFELIKEVIRYILNTGYNKSNLETLNIIKERESITKDSLLAYMDYLFSFTSNHYKKLGLKAVLNNMEVYYQIHRVLLPKKDCWKEEESIVTIRDNLIDKYINKYRIYGEAASKVLYLLQEDKRLNRPDQYKYKIIAYISYDASDIEDFIIHETGRLNEIHSSTVPDYIDKSYYEYEEPVRCIIEEYLNEDSK